MSLKKSGISFLEGGFTQIRRQRRPLRVETLLKKLVGRQSTVDLVERKLKPSLFLKSGSAHSLIPEMVSDLALGILEKLALAELRTDLLPHQQRVVERLRGQPGVVVAHGLGSGKTLTSIAAIADAAPGKVTVIVPAALRENYEKEIKKHVRGRFPVQVTSLQKITRDGVVTGDTLVVDEAHRIRNPRSKAYQVIAEAPASKRILLTGSPVYNAPEDIAPLVNLAAGEKILPVGKSFETKYTNKVVARKRRETQELGNVLNKWVDYHGSVAEGFPQLEEKKISVPMSAQQKLLHDYAWNQLPASAKSKLKKGLVPSKKDLYAINVFESQARQIASSGSRFAVTPEPSPKILTATKSLKNELEKNPEHRAVVYANFLGTLNEYAQELEKDEIPYAQFTGEMTNKVRQQAVRDYNDGKIKALLISGAGGEGLDLKRTRQVQVLEPHWNEEKVRQVIGRARRYKSHEGLPPEEQKVTVERYAAYPKQNFLLDLIYKRKGIDDMLYGMSDRKQRVNDQIISLLKEEGKKK